MTDPQRAQLERLEAELGRGLSARMNAGNLRVIHPYRMLVYVFDPAGLESADRPCG